MEQAAHGLRPALSAPNGGPQVRVVLLMTTWTAWLSRPCSCRLKMEPCVQLPSPHSCFAREFSNDLFAGHCKTLLHLAHLG